MLSSGVIRRIEEQFAPTEQAAAKASVARIGRDLIGWRIVVETDRIERAALAYADRDLMRLVEAVDLALVDWRDLLVAVGDA